MSEWFLIFFGLTWGILFTYAYSLWREWKLQKITDEAFDELNQESRRTLLWIKVDLKKAQARIECLEFQLKAHFREPTNENKDLTNDG